MADARYLRGSTKQCPKCGSRSVAHDSKLAFRGYGPGLARCANCRTLWEPFEPDQIWDTSDPHCSFKEPCNNCAFRPGSDEQKDRQKWKRLIDSLKCGSSFYCHKGVPIEAGAEHGFAYPERVVAVEIDGKSVETKLPDVKKLRICRGYLNALPGLHKAFVRESRSGSDHD